MSHPATIAQAAAGYDAAGDRNHVLDGTADLHAVWGSGPEDVWVVGGTTVLHFDGMSWSQPAGLPMPAMSFGSVQVNVSATD